MGSLILRLFSGFLGFAFKGIVAKFFCFFRTFLYYNGIYSRGD